MMIPSAEDLSLQKYYYSVVLQWHPPSLVSSTIMRHFSHDFPTRVARPSAPRRTIVLDTKLGETHCSLKKKSDLCSV